MAEQGGKVLRNLLGAIPKRVYLSCLILRRRVRLKYYRELDGDRMKNFVKLLIAVTMLMAAGTASAATLTAHVSGCGGVASYDSLLDTLPDGTTYYSPIDKYVSLKKGWLRTDTDGFVTWDGPVQTKTWTLYYAVKVMTPAGTLQSHTAKIVMMPCV